MRYSTSNVRTRSLWPHAIIATAVVVLLPLAGAIAARPFLPQPRTALILLLALVGAGVAAMIGSNLWLRRPESLDIQFGELMLWTYLRRLRAERQIATSAHTLRLDASGHPARDLELDPEEQLEVLHGLTGALESKDPYTHGHSRRVERHAYRTALALGLTSVELEELRLAASLHDVGKIAVPDKILRKPEQLSSGEQKVVRQHPSVGAAMVESSVSADVVEAVRHHHESWDGSGYPAHLAGTTIPVYARIIAVADAFDAMTSARPYKPGCTRREAVDVLREAAGAQFDPRVVEAFISTLPSTLPIAGALVIFSAPSRGLKRIAAWVRDATGGTITGAAGATGMIALLGAVMIPSAPVTPVEGSPRGGGGGVEPPPAAHAAPIPGGAVEDEVLDQLFGAVEEADANIKMAPVVEDAASFRTDEAAEPAPAPAPKVKEQGGKGDPPPPREDASTPEPADQPSSPGNSGGGPAPQPSQPKASNGHTPPGDPQPERGRDCDPDRGNGQNNGKGQAKHCG